MTRHDLIYNILILSAIYFSLTEVEAFTALSVTSSAFDIRRIGANLDDPFSWPTSAASCSSAYRSDRKKPRSKAFHTAPKAPTLLNLNNVEHGDGRSIDFINPFSADPIEWVACFLANLISSTVILQPNSEGFINEASSSANNTHRISNSDETSYSGDLSMGMDGEVLAAQIKTLVRVGLPAFLLAAIGSASYPSIAMLLAEILENDHGVFAVLSQDASQYVQNILTTSGLMFSILVGYSYYFLYQQQERVFYALFEEVSEAKSLLEQVSLICAGRSIYQKVLSYMSAYVCDDLKQMSTVDPVESLSLKPSDDPLEGILYLTSVGEPGVVYDTIKSLRQARSHRLGALQKKLPDIHIFLLRTLGAIVLVTFPVCGSGSQVIGGQGILEVQAIFFGVMIFGLSIVLGVISELWSPRGGAYNVDGVLAIMVRGLEEELRARMSGELGGPLGVTNPTVDTSVLLSGEKKDTKVEGQFLVDDRAAAESIEMSRKNRRWRSKLFHRASDISLK